MFQTNEQGDTFSYNATLTRIHTHTHTHRIYSPLVVGHSFERTITSGLTWEQSVYTEAMNQDRKSVV